MWWFRSARFALADAEAFRLRAWGGWRRQHVEALERALYSLQRAERCRALARQRMHLSVPFQGSTDALIWVQEDAA